MKLENKKIDALNQELKLVVEAEDYAATEKKMLNERKKNAEFKGFRKGMVPAALIQKVYGEQCLAESVNQAVGTALDNYIKENKLNVLGEPLPSKNQPEQEWKDGNAFTFVFDIALSPSLDFKVEKGDTVTSYTVTVSADEKKKMVENMKKFYSEQAAKAKEDGKEAPVAKTDEEIEKEVSERLEGNYKSESEWRLGKDIRKFYVEKSKVEIPEDFLKRWLLVANEGKVTEEQVEKEFPGFAEDFKWQLVRGYLMKKYEFKIEEADLREAAKAYVSYQYAMYGLSQVPEDMMKGMVDNMLQDRKQIETLVEQVEEQKVISKLKEEITIKDKKIASDKFRELK